ncbi:MAG: histidine phosphatase family protein [Alphaproteobacteria bacterium]
MGRLYMIRHGKPNSTWSDNVGPDPGLDATGLAQADAAAAALLALPEEFRPLYVVSSPLRRCQETAAPFARALGVAVEIDPTFTEIPTPANVPHEERPAWLRRAFGGTWGEMTGDIDYPAWREAIVEGLKSRDRTAVFSHYVAINAAVSALTGSDAVLAFNPGHCSITSFELRDGVLQLCERGAQAETKVL